MDLLFGDPRPWHPVRGIGKLGELGFRLWGTRGYGGGFLTLLFTVLLCELLVLGTVRLWPPFEILWLFYALALKSLLGEVEGVYGALAAEDLEEARRRLSWLVSRDTGELDERGVVRGAIETLAENFNDAFCGPLFWYLVAGLPGVVLYKVVEILDSMFGYRHEPYRKFGFFPARLDDLLNFCSARLSALFLALAAPFLGFSGRRALGTAFREARKHLSPNAGWPEAAMAGALGVALGGPTPYRGRVEDYPYLGTPLRDLRKEDIKLALRLVKGAALIGFGIFLLGEVLLWKYGYPNLIVVFTRKLPGIWTI